ncbi:lipocalin-like domain-containing protein [Risungbinella massiliensis]|uniref:lipocalin-like domain-containing protein n=1 Tax=Risungbinella massiliensis TaxID=1329796 RepID=UPI0005CC5718|nr:lipocalin-like domain-containing protein [Risungbinella massiliensis]
MTTKVIPTTLGSQAEHYEKLGLIKGQIAPWEDGMRTDGSAGTYEWWYFDSHLNDGSKLVIVFYTKPMMEIDSPLTPYVSFTWDLPDGRTIQRTYAATSEKNFFASTEQCEVRIGANVFKGNLHDYQIHIEMDELVADISLSGKVPPWRPETGYWLYGEQDEHYFAWLPSVPQGKVEAMIQMGEDYRQYTGMGYHDHNWGNIAMPALMNNWYWGRAQVGDYTVIVCNITAEEQYGYKAHPVFMLAKGNKILADDGNLIRLTKRDEYLDDLTGKPVANTLVYEYEEEDKHYTVTFQREKDISKYRFIDTFRGAKKEAAIAAGFDGAYLRFTGEVRLEVLEGKEIVESLQNEAIWDLMHLGKARQKQSTK